MVGQELYDVRLLHFKTGFVFKTIKFLIIFVTTHMNAEDINEETLLQNLSELMEFHKLSFVSRVQTHHGNQELNSSRSVISTSYQSRYPH